MGIAFLGSLVLVAEPAAAQARATDAPGLPGVPDRPPADLPPDGAAPAPVAPPTKPPVYLKPIHEEIESPQFDEPFGGVLSEHLYVGAGVVDFSLKDNKGGGRFLGSIDEIEKENGPFIAPYIGWAFNRFFCVECRYENYEARTFTDTPDNHTDGVVELKGPVPYLLGRLPLDVVAAAFDPGAPAPEWTRRVAPFCGVGYTMMSVSMNAEPWWALGYSSPARYRELGSPSVNNNGYYRSFDLQDENTMVLIAGLHARLTRRLGLDLSWSQADFDIDSSFSLRGGRPTPGTIPFHFTTLGAMVSYIF
jgi:hypothetical protein